MAIIINEMKPESSQEAVEILFYRSKKNPKEIRKFAKEHGFPLDASAMSRFLNENNIKGPGLYIIDKLELFCDDFPITKYLYERMQNHIKRRCMIGEKTESDMGMRGSAPSSENNEVRL